jgi:HSP20 family protein
MARRTSGDDDLLMEDDELTAAFLGDEDGAAAPAGDQNAAAAPVAASDEWDESEDLPGQLAVDVYESREKLVVRARTAGMNKNDLDVSFSDNTLSIRGTLSAGATDDVENYFVQEIYYGEFSRSITLPVPLKQQEKEPEHKHALMTITNAKLKQDTIKKIQVL